ncbi:unnamed protein product [Haemonchus placei]|uniref:Reverse transcriptase domain-containing protein n=1 Tax=Haemonchus placei TaxID=6290 RepID=A0A0N4X3D9_HAEPC|nr:unnamed protein product [Haemonchus placei]
MLLNICLDFVMRKTTQQTTVGVRWFNDERLIDLDFTDVIALIADDKSGLQKFTDTLNEEASMIGSRITASKSKAMSYRNRLLWKDCKIYRCVQETPASTMVTIVLISKHQDPPVFFHCDPYCNLCKQNIEICCEFSQKVECSEMSVKDREDTAHGSHHE